MGPFSGALSFKQNAQTQARQVVLMSDKHLAGGWQQVVLDQETSKSEKTRDQQHRAWHDQQLGGVQERLALYAFTLSSAGTILSGSAADLYSVSVRIA